MYRRHQTTKPDLLGILDLVPETIATPTGLEKWFGLGIWTNFYHWSFRSRRTESRRKSSVRAPADSTDRTILPESGHEPE